MTQGPNVVEYTHDCSGGFRGGSGGSIEPPFLGNSKFLQFIPPINFMYHFEPVLHFLKLSEVVTNILYYLMFSSRNSL